MTVEEKIKKSNDILSVVHLYKFIIAVLLLVVLFLSLALFKAVNKKQLIVAVDNERLSVPLTMQEGQVGNLVNYTQFISYFLNLLYDWDYTNYSKNVEQAMYFMDKTCREEYLREVTRQGRVQQVNEYHLTQSLTIRRIDTDNVIKTDKGYQVKVSALKLKVHDFISRPIPVEITVGFKTTNISNKNYWGLEIYEIKEVNLE